MTVASALDLVTKPSRVAAAATADNAPINFSGTYKDGATLPAGTHAVAYAGAQLAAVGGSGAGYVYDLISELPGGMALNASGAISGTPLAASSRQVIIRVTDNAGNAVAGAFALVVA